MFWAKTTKEREAYVDFTYEEKLKLLKDEISALRAKQLKQDAEILDIATSQDIIRNKVLRKIQGKKKTEESEDIDSLTGIPYG